MEALTRVRQRSLGQPPDGGAAGTEGRTSRTWASMFLAVCVKRVPKASSTNAADMPSVEAGEAGRRQERGLRSLAKITEVMDVHQRRRSSLHEIDSMAFWETKRASFPNLRQRLLLLRLRWRATDSSPLTLVPQRATRQLASDPSGF